MKENEIINIESAVAGGDFKLLLRFSDGSERLVDFGPFLRGSSNPLIQRYLDAREFARFEVRDGDLVWGDWELCFPIADLYDGRI